MTDMTWKERFSENDDTVDLLSLPSVIWNGRKLIIIFTMLITVLAAAATLLMNDVYTAKAVLKPLTRGGGSRFYFMASQTNPKEMVNIINSNAFNKKVIEQHDLLPVLFPEKWDNEKKQWRTSDGGAFPLNPLKFIQGSSSQKKTANGPDIWDGIRELKYIVNASYSTKDEVVIISVNFRDPKMASQIVNNIIATLTEQMTAEIKHTAVINRKYLEKILKEARLGFDKLERGNMLAAKIDAQMTEELEGNYAFKILDPPMAPDQKSGPKRFLIVAGAFGSALFLSIFIALFKNYARTVRTGKYS